MESPSVQTQPPTDEPSWIVEWFVIAILGALVVCLLVGVAHGSTKKIDDLGLDLIDRVKVIWPTVHCEEWPDKNGDYKCSGTFYVHAQAIKANKTK